MNNHERYPNLRHLFAAYLHQDWTMEYDEAEQALAAACADAPEALISAAVIEISDLLCRNHPEDELADLMLHYLGCYYAPASDGLSHREWLQCAQGILARHEERRHGHR